MSSVYRSSNPLATNTKFELTIPGEPVAKARPRVTKTGHTYTPAKTADYERQIKESYIIRHGWTLLEGSLSVTVNAYFKIPKNTSKKKFVKFLLGIIKPTKRPDIDNVTKAVLDALNGIAYRDDSQITTLLARKRYSDRPRVEVIIENDDVEDEL